MTSRGGPSGIRLLGLLAYLTLMSAMLLCESSPALGADLGKSPKQARVITASGVGRITEDNQYGRIMARRAALTDARRNLLIEAQKLLGTYDGKNKNVSGRVGPHSITSEKIEGAYYKVEISALMQDIVIYD
ncbi:MAG: hypothetical protein LBT23_10745 [Synergistaceae bacterium]|jgi:hypothetical protein|nr:hypothetical protein [Synergistaceae bacterium]